MPLKGGIGNWIKDFKKSDAPQFKGKSDEKKRDMAIAAYLDAKEEYREKSGTRNIHEISKGLAGRYIKKRAGDDMPHAGAMMNDPHDAKRRKKGVRDYVKMQKGIKTAVNKLTGHPMALVPAKEENAYMVAKMARQSDDNLKSMMKKTRDAEKKDPNMSSLMSDHISKEMKKRGMKESTSLSKLKKYLNRS